MSANLKENKALNEALANLKLDLTSPRPRSPDTLRSYLSIARQFLSWLGDKTPATDKDVRRYILKRRQEKIKESSLQTTFDVLHKLFEANSWEWRFKAGDRPEASPGLKAIPFRKDEVEELIKNRDRYSKGERFYLSIETIFAPRRVELATIKSRSIRDNTLFIDTHKRGRKVWHLIPAEILPYISVYKPREHNVSSLSAMFDRICVKCFGQKRKGYGWHSFRYTLETLLPIELAKAGKPLTLVGDFLRYSRKTVAARYLGTPTVGVYQQQEVVTDDLHYTDRQVFEVHPFLSLWQA